VAPSRSGRVATARLDLGRYSLRLRFTIDGGGGKKRLSHSSAIRSPQFGCGYLGQPSGVITLTHTATGLRLVCKRHRLAASLSCAYHVGVDKKTLSGVMRHLGRRRAKVLSKEQRVEIASKAGSATWAGMTKEQRSAEMKRRAKVRAVNKLKKSKRGR